MINVYVFPFREIEFRGSGPMQEKKKGIDVISQCRRCAIWREIRDHLRQAQFLEVWEILQLERFSL